MRSRDLSEGQVTITASKPQGSSWYVRADVIRQKAVPKWTFSYDDGYSSWFSVPSTFNGPRLLKAWAICL